MKYSITINQKKAVELGITNINQVIIFDLLSISQTWAQPEIINNEVYYWVARQKICDQLVILKMKPDTVYRHLRSLEKIGLIDYKKKGKKDLIRISEKGNLYHYVGNKSESTMSEINPNSETDPRKFGNKSEKNSEINPTYNNYKYNNTYNINNNPVSNEMREKYSHEFDLIWKGYFESCKKQGRNAGSKAKAKSLYAYWVQKESSLKVQQSISNYINDCLSRDLYLKNLQSFLSKSEKYVEEWFNNSENHLALLEFKKNGGNTPKMGRGFKSKSERIDEDVLEYRKKIMRVLDDNEEKPKELPF